jgi:aryl-alcohol dehydrogenase-like predicted oxidoreductase
MIAQRTLGTSHPQFNAAMSVSAMGLGCMGMTPIYSKPDPAVAIATVHRAVELGCTFLDSSDAYAFGANEQLLATAIKLVRGKITLATKFGQIRSPDGTMVVSGKPEYVQAACEASLKRLGVEVIDLYYQHRVDPTVPIEETVGAMKRLIEQGKVRALGLSEAAAATIRRAHKVHPITALQTEYSLFTRDVEREILPTSRELGIGFVAYSPLGRGILTGAYQSLDVLGETDRRRAMPRYQGEALANNTRLMQPLLALAAKTGDKPSQLAIAWVLSRGPDIVPIPGTNKPARLEENLGALGVEATKAELDAMGAAIDAAQVAGTRYPADHMPRVGL